MPLHLLGKKSWNVYNQDNIERVKRDEDQARADERDAERKRRDDDTSERLRVLRGGGVEQEGHVLITRPGGKRKREHEDDNLGGTNKHDQKHHRLSSSRKSQAHQSLGGDSHNNDTTLYRSKPDASADPLDSISNMRFRDAAGRHSEARNPWYSKSTVNNPDQPVSRDVWGNEDLGRKTRDQKRLDAGDPLLAIKRGVKQLREVEKQKSEWRREREKDLNEVEDLARREKRRRRREREAKGERDLSSDKNRHSDQPRDRCQHNKVKSERGTRNELYRIS